MEFKIEKGKLNGIIHCFSEYGNPRLIVKASQRSIQIYNISNIFNYENNDNSAHFVSAVQNPFIEIYFPKQKLFLSNYSLQSHFSVNFYMQTWKLSGSTNGINWVPLHSTLNQSYLMNGNIETFPSNETKKGFTKFKLEMTGPTPYPDTQMRIKHIELFGRLVSIRDSCMYKKTSTFSPSFFLFILFLS